ncbi:MAG TPA: aminotransferase class IV [Acidimicrobiia bacterium]|nr:aminotransferase class IV [Acidimicrobiia bacterium]
MTDPTVWVDGALLPAGTARVSPFDHGLLVGNGVFETLRVYDGVPFAWTRHLQRLGRSAGGLGLETPDPGELRAAVDQVLRGNRLSEGRVRITVTGGPSPLGSERGDAPPTVIVAASAMASWPASTAVVTVPWTRNEHGAVTGLKTISYAENVRALAFAREKGGGEAIFANTAGNLCEATGSNVFLAFDGTLCTPPESAGILAGVTRALVLELCEREGVPAEERDVPIDALAGADEAFLTSSTREVQPIDAVDGQPLPVVPGALTERVTKAFTDLVARDTDP